MTTARAMATGTPTSVEVLALIVTRGHTTARETLRGPLLCESELR